MMEVKKGMEVIINTGDSYVYHNLVKYHCYPCDKEFIVSEYQRNNSKNKIICPYCHDDIVEAYVWMNEDLEELGDLAIGHCVKK